MTEQKRLIKIKELIAERDKYIVDGEVTSYPEHDSILFRINEDGHIDWMVERIQELELDLHGKNKVIATMGYEGVVEQNQRYKQALEFYANEGNYELRQVAWDEWTSNVLEDSGDKARNALKGDSNDHGS